MGLTLQSAGYKLYCLYLSAKIGLFPKKFIYFPSNSNKKQIVDILIKAKFKDFDPVAIRFSKNNNYNLPKFLGKFSLNEIADKITTQENDLIPFIHELIIPVNSGQLYFEKNKFYIELWPGISTGDRFSEPPDIIEINKRIKIHRYIKKRKAETISGNIFTEEPFSLDYLLFISNKILSMLDKFKYLNNHLYPLLCDFHFDEEQFFYVMGAQHTDLLGVFNSTSDDSKDFFIANSYDDLKQISGNEKVVLNIPISRDEGNLVEIIKLAKCFSEVYVRNIASHFSILLRESGVKVKRFDKITEYSISYHSLNDILSYSPSITFVTDKSFPSIDLTKDH